MIGAINLCISAIGSVFSWLAAIIVPLGNGSSISILYLDLSIIVASLIVMFIMAFIRKGRVNIRGFEIKDNYGEVNKNSKNNKTDWKSDW